VFVLALYCVETAAFLAVDVHMRRIRYAFPLLPSAIVLAAFGIACGTRWLRRVGMGPAVPVALTVLALLLVARSVRADKDAANRWSDPRIALGDWLAATYPPDTSILSDEYVYVPPRLAKVRYLLAFTRKDVGKHPTLLVLSQDGSGRFSWKRTGTRFEDGDFAHSQLDDADTYVRFHRWLTSAEGGYVVVRDEPRYVVLEYKPPPPAPDPMAVSSEN
jgi:hypothetical protein